MGLRITMLSFRGRISFWMKPDCSTKVLANLLPQRVSIMFLTVIALYFDVTKRFCMASNVFNHNVQHVKKREKNVSTAYFWSSLPSTDAPWFWTRPSLGRSMAGTRGRRWRRPARRPIRTPPGPTRRSRRGTSSRYCLQRRVRRKPAALLNRPAIVKKK